MITTARTFFTRSRKLALALCLALPATALFPEEKLEPTEEMTEQTRWVVDTINSRHYLRETMEQLDGAEIIEAFAESFDRSKMYLLEKDLEDFEFRFAEPMENILENGNLYAAFEIYRHYEGRVKERTDWILDRLEKDFDFSTEETFDPDREEADWPENRKAADELWERRLKYELLNEMLSLASEEKEEDAGGGLEPDNPDLLESPDENDSADPEKLKRLVKDPGFRDKTLAKAVKKIKNRYERNRNYTLDRKAQEVQESFINAMTQLFDPHSSFLSADTLENFNSSVQNSFVGIGALLQNEEGVCTIKEILPGGPAEESGLLDPEDEILGVAQGEDGEFEDVIDMRLRYIVRKIKGEKGTKVRLLIRPGDAADPSVRKEITLVRDEVKLTANLASARLIDVPRENDRTVPVGVIKVPSFYGNIGAGETLSTTSEDVRELINRLKEAGAEGLILDLRMNGGGLLSEAIRVAGLFMPAGPVVQVRDNDSSVDVLSARNSSIAWEGPLIVLTSRFSASASEIVAGALRDHNRALVVGNSSTHGKGTVQEVYHKRARSGFAFFGGGGDTKSRPVASKITIKQFYLPDGSSTQLKGVPSDIELPSVNEHLPIGESDLPHALPWNEIDPVDWNADWEKRDVEALRDPELRQKLAESSEDRQSSLNEFEFLREQIEWRRKRIEETEVSLNLGQRIDKKVREQKRIDELDDTFEELKKKNYAGKEFIVQVAQEQEEESRRNRSENESGKEAADKAEGEGETEIVEKDIGSGEEGGDAQDAEGPGDDGEGFDIHLRESARIMADWLEMHAAAEDRDSATASAGDKETGAL